MIKCCAKLPLFITHLFILNSNIAFCNLKRLTDFSFFNVHVLTNLKTATSNRIIKIKILILDREKPV